MKLKPSKTVSPQSRRSAKKNSNRSKGSSKNLKNMVNPIYLDEPELTGQENLELRSLRRRYGWQPNRLS